MNQITVEEAIELALEGKALNQIVYALSRDKIYKRYSPGKLPSMRGVASRGVASKKVGSVLKALRKPVVAKAAKITSDAAKKARTLGIIKNIR